MGDFTTWAPATAVHAVRLTDIALLVHEQFAAGADLFELDANVRRLLRASDQQNFEQASALFTNNPAVVAALAGVLDGCDPAEAETDADQIMRMAVGVSTAGRPQDSPAGADIGVAPAVGEEAPAELAGADIGAAAPAAGETLAELATRALRVLAEYSALADQPLADRLEVSRAVLMNWRKGRTPWIPTHAQLRTVLAVLHEYADPLGAVLSDLQSLVELN